MWHSASYSVKMKTNKEQYERRPELPDGWEQAQNEEGEWFPHWRKVGEFTNKVVLPIHEITWTPDRGWERHRCRSSSDELFTDALTEGDAKAILGDFAEDVPNSIPRPSDRAS